MFSTFIMSYIIITAENTFMPKQTSFAALLCLLAAIFFFTPAAAQSRQVTGKVINDADGQPMTGVSITVKGKSSGTQTMPDGSFSINASNGEVLEFSYLGFATQSVTISPAASFD